MANIVGGDKGKSILVKFLEKVKDFLTRDMVETTVLNALCEKELNKRSAAWVVCFENLQKLSSEMNKINRPDKIEYTSPDKATKKEIWSEERIKEIDKLREKIDKHERALDKFLEGDTKDVYELNQQSNQQHKSKDGGKSSDGAAGENT